MAWSTASLYFRPTAGLLLLGWGWSCLGCAPQELDVPGIVAIGDRVAVGTDIQVDVCAGTLRKLDAHVSVVEEALGLPELDERIPVYVIGDAARADRLCRNPGRGCYIPKERGGPAVVIGPDDFERNVYHELAHAVHYRSRIGRPPDFLAEGIATAFGSEGGDLIDDVPLHTLLARFDEGTYEFSDALQVARFLRYLLNDHEPKQLVDWAARLNWRDEAGAIEVAFQQTFGATLGSEWARFAGGEPFPGLARCLAPLVAWRSEHLWRLDVANDCTSPNVQTNFEQPSSPLTEVLVDIPERDDYFVDLPIGDAAEVSYVACDDINLATFWSPRVLGAKHQPLHQARYRLRSASPPEESQLLIRKPPEPAYCDVWRQDCPARQKCQARRDWPYLRVDCAPLAEDALGEGETCEPPVYPASDPCDMGLECSPQSFTCAKLCEDAGGRSRCPEDAACFNGADGKHPGLCEPSCSPLTQRDCPHAGQSCKFIDGHFLCVGVTGDLSAGAACSLAIECGDGLHCHADAAPSPQCIGESGCCTSYCDVTEVIEACTNSAARCIPLANEIGVCSPAD